MRKLVRSEWYILSCLCFVVIASALLLSGCEAGSSPSSNSNPTYTVTYNGNGPYSGSVPTDSQSYQQGQTVTVLGNTGDLTKSGYTFTGWNTLADGTGTTYDAEANFTMGSANVILYAKWTVAATYYTVTYDGNGNTGGLVPSGPQNFLPGDPVGVLPNSYPLVKTGSVFTGWNTLANGTGTDYSPLSAFTMGSANVTLYAKWLSGAVSENTASPSALSLDTLSSYVIDKQTVGYVGFPTTYGNGYGVYVTPNAPLTMQTGSYYLSGWNGTGVGSVNPTGNELRQGFKAGTVNSGGAMIINTSDSIGSFSVIVRNGMMGGNYLATPVSISLNTPTWIAATALSGSGFNDFSFVAGGTTTTVQFDSLTAGVDIEVLSLDKTTTVFPLTTDGSATQVTKTVNVTGLTNGGTYVLRVSSHVVGTNGASVGQLTIQ